MQSQRETLIAKARLLGHSDAALARRIGMTPQQFSAIAKGRETLPPEVAALLADMVGGITPMEAAARQMLENAREPRRSMLEKVLFTLGVLGVSLAGIGTPTASDAKVTAADQITEAATSLYIMLTCSVRYIRALRTRLRGLRPLTWGSAPYPGPAAPASGSPC